MRLALVVEYEGTQYHGFQYQGGAISIQEELEKAVESLTGERVRVRGAGRTDSGVHAERQVVAFDTGSTHTMDTFVRALNHYLPGDIAVREAYRVSERFDPRRHATNRRYRYTILNRRSPSPLLRGTTCLIAETLNVRRMQRAAGLLVGTHDFARFAGPLRDGRTSTTRHMYQASVRRRGELVTFDVDGNAFLPHQVRRMAGALVDIGRRTLSLDEFKLMVDGGGDAVAHSLPPQGLCLMEVAYDDFPPKVGE